MSLNRKAAKKINLTGENDIKHPIDLSILLIEHCKDYLKGGNLLDMTLGLNNYSYDFHKRGFKIHGLDSISNTLGTQHELNFEPILELQKIKEPPVPYQSNFFDLVLAINILQHFEDLSPIIQKVQRLLKPGGIFAFTYEKSLSLYHEENNMFFQEKVTNESTTYSHHDGYLQHLLMENNFFIQQEREYLILKKERLDYVIIIAQKKNLD